MSTQTKVISGSVATAIVATVLYFFLQTGAPIFGVYYTGWGSCTYPPDSIMQYNPTYVIWFNGSASLNPPYISFYAGSSDSMNFETGHNYCGNDNHIIAKRFIQLNHGTKLVISLLDNQHILDQLVQDTVAGGKCDQLIENMYGFSSRHQWNGWDIDNEYPYNTASCRNGWDVFSTRAKQRHPDMYLTVACPAWGLWGGSNGISPIYNLKFLNTVDVVQLMMYNQMSGSTAGYNAPLWNNYGGGWSWNIRGPAEYKKMGVNPKKIVLIVSAEGHKMTASGWGASSSGNYSFYNYSSFPQSVWNSPYDSSYGAAGSVIPPYCYSVETIQSINAKVDFTLNSSLGGNCIYDPWRWLQNGSDPLTRAMATKLQGGTVIVPPPLPVTNPLQWTQSELDSAKATVVCPTCPDTTGLFLVGANWYKSLLPDSITLVGTWTGNGRGMTVIIAGKDTLQLIKP